MNNLLKGIKYIYLDMDGVLANMGSQLLDDKGEVLEDRQEMVKRFSTPGFYESMPAYENNLKVVKYLINLKKYDIHILSSSHNERIDKEKRAWLKKHLSEIKEENIIFTRSNGKNRIEKGEYVKTPFSQSLLIDDYFLNLIEWKNRGGKCIKYVNEFDSVNGRHTDHNILYITDFSQILENKNIDLNDFKESVAE